jgi:hypothetical protein
MRRKLKWLGGLFALVLLVLGSAVFIKMGPRFVFGMLRYDTRQEGALRVGDRAPDVEVLSIDGKSVRLLEPLRSRPLVLIFGSFT